MAGGLLTGDEHGRNRRVQHGLLLGELHEQLRDSGHMAEAIGGATATQLVAVDGQLEGREAPVLRVGWHDIQVAASEGMKAHPRNEVKLSLVFVAHAPGSCIPAHDAHSRGFRGARVLHDHIATSLGVVDALHNQRAAVLDLYRTEGTCCSGEREKARGGKRRYARCGDAAPRGRGR